MTAEIIAGVWLVGWVAAIRPALRRTMLQPVCSKCDAEWACNCKDRARVFGEKAPAKVPRGSRFERNGYDVAWSMWIAVWWPVWLWWVCTDITLCALGRGVKTIVVRAVPLTGPELERRIAERDKEIVRLTKEIEEDHHESRESNADRDRRPHRRAAGRAAQLPSREGYTRFPD